MSSKRVSAKKVIGSESRSSVLNRLGLAEYKSPSVGIQIINGIPCKFKNGEWVQLTRLEK